jgi:hypothetical protein
MAEISSWTDEVAWGDGSDPDALDKIPGFVKLPPPTGETRKEPEEE